MKKSLIILLGIVGALLLVAILVLQKPGELSTSETGKQLFEIDSAAVQKIRLHTLTADIVIEKQGAEWQLVQPLSYKADQSAVGRLLHQVKNITAKAVVSEKPEKHALFRVDSAGIRITLWDQSKEVADFILGKGAQTYTQAYLRKATEDAVYIVEGLVEYQVRRDVKEWRDKTIATALRENIRSLTYQFGDTTFTVAFEDSTWVIGKEKVQESLVQSVLSGLTNFQADDFVDTLQTFPKPVAVLSYTGIQIQFAFDKQTQKYLVRTSQSPQIFSVAEWRVKQVLKRKKEFLQK